MNDALARGAGDSPAFSLCLPGKPVAGEPMGAAIALAGSSDAEFPASPIAARRRK